MARRKTVETKEDKYEEFLKCVRPFMGYGYSLNKVIAKWNAQCLKKGKEEWCYVHTTVYKWFESDASFQIRFDIENAEKLDDLDMAHYNFAAAQVSDTVKGNPQAAQWILARKHPDYKEQSEKGSSISIKVQSEDIEYAKNMISKIKID